MDLYSISSPYYTAGILVKGNRVVKAAPIIKWTVDKDIGYLKNYFKRKKFRIERVQNDST